MRFQKKKKIPVGASGQRSSLGTHGQRVDFRGVQPWHTQHTDAKGNIVEEEEGDRSHGVLVAVARDRVHAQQNANEQESEELTKGGEQHQRSTAPSLNQWNGGEGKDEVGDGVASDEETRHVGGKTNGFLEHSGQVVRHNVDTAKLEILLVQMHSEGLGIVLPVA